MSLKPIPCFTVVCDWPGCENDMLEDDDYSGYGETDFLLEQVREVDWHQTPDGQQHYCDKHPTVWESDLADGLSPEPKRPYLMIHDPGDGTSMVCDALEDPRQPALDLGAKS